MPRAPPSTVFVANVDKWVPSKLAEYISKTHVGKSLAEDEDEDEEDEDAPPKTMYSIIGTLSSPDAVKPAFLSRLVSSNPEDEELHSVLLECDLIVWDIASETQMDACTSAVEMLFEAIPKFTRPKTFVCMSSVLTWAKTRPADPEDVEGNVLEEEYKRRRPHLRYRPQMDCEKIVLKCGKKTGGKLTTYVVNAGITYGSGEDTFHPLFKTAWLLQESHLPMPTEGNNIIPTIHVTDLCGAVLNVLESKPETKYILAVDESQHTLSEIMNVIAETLGSGKVQSVPSDSDKVKELLSQHQLDQLCISLRLEAPTIKELTIPWIAQGGIVESMQAIVQEYRQSRNLVPLKVCVLGPPAIGKTSYAERLEEQYKLVKVHKDEVIAEAIETLKASAARLNGTDEDELDEEVKAKATEDSETLAQLKESLEENNGSYEESQIIAWVRAKLRSQQCLNHGFVLDGFPETQDQANELFAADDDAEDPDAPDALTVPEFIFALNGDDKFLLDRAMELPEGTPWSEEAMPNKLAAYRKLNTDEATVLNYFDFKEIHPYHFDIQHDELTYPTSNKDGSILDAYDFDHGPIISRMQLILGEPRNFGLTPDEQAAYDEVQNAKEEARSQAEALATAERDAVERAHAEKQQQLWDEKRRIVQQQAEEAMEAGAAPLRSFLMKHIMPTLTDALVEVNSVRPEDPVDFLAEYLLRNNPKPNLT